MKKSKILLSALSVTAIMPTLPMVMASCSNGNSKTYLVSFDSNGGTSVLPQTVIEGKCAVAPAVSREGYSFVRWETTDGEPFNFTTPIKSDLTLKAVWDVKTIGILLYANDGTFEDGNSYKLITGIAPGTKLSEITDYEHPTPTKEDYTFAYWLDLDNAKYTADTKINESLVLGAQYKEAETGTTYAESSWAKIVKETSSALNFAKVYFSGTFSGTTEDDAIEFLNNQIRSGAENPTSATLPDKKIKITIQGVQIETKVRLIGVGFDKSSTNNDKTLFTFEFVDTIAKTRYTIDNNDHIWYMENSEGEVTSEAFLRRYCNNILINSLPASVVAAIQPVTKVTVTPKTDSGVVREDVTTSELLFPLSLNEMGINAFKDETQYSLDDVEKATKTYPYYRFEYSDTKKTNIVERSKKLYAIDGTNYPEYWTRDPISVFVSAGCQHNVCYIGNQGNTTGYTLARNPLFGVAPAFCL